MKIKSIKYVSLYKDVLNTVSWLSSMGFDYGKTRIGIYEKIIKELAENYRSYKDGSISGTDFKNYANTIYEIFDLIDIYKGLKNCEDDALAGLLKKLMSGPMEYEDENPYTSSNLARNTSFHLLIASKLNQAEITPSLEVPNDIGFMFDGKRLLLECKRTQHYTKLAKNIKIAKKQIRSKTSTKIGSNYLGIIAIDITKLINPEFYLLVKNTPEDIKYRLDQITNTFISKNNHIWQKHDNSKIVGVIVHFSIMSVIEDIDMLTHCRQITFNPIEYISETRKLFVWNLSKKLGSLPPEIILS